MKWESTVSPAWLKARQFVLTASDIKELVPYTRTGRARKITDDDYMKVYANKIKRLTLNDCRSIGAAARGHILEPYAIQEAELILDERIYHWDDCLIAGLDVGYSPDGLDIEQRYVNYVTNTHLKQKPTVLTEVKCYSSEKHLQKYYGDKFAMEERWQIATAMYVSDSIERAHLVFYDPSLKEFQVGIHEYSRSDLDDEINIIGDVVIEWVKFKIKTDALSGTTGMKAKFTETEIFDEYSKAHQLNP